MNAHLLSSSSRPIVEEPRASKEPGRRGMKVESLATRPLPSKSSGRGRGRAAGAGDAGDVDVRAGDETTVMVDGEIETATPTVMCLGDPHRDLLLKEEKRAHSQLTLNEHQSVQ